MIIKPILIPVFYLFFLSVLSAQTPTSLKYEAMSFGLNEILTNINADYFAFENPIRRITDTINTDNTIHDTTKLEFYNLETYEPYFMTMKEVRALKSVPPTPKEVAERQRELDLWDFKGKLGKKVVLVTSYPIKGQKDELKNYKPFNKYHPVSKTQKKLARAVSKLDSIFTDAQQLSSEKYLFVQNTKENVEQYKYAIVAYFYLSDVVFNKNKTECAFFYGLHYYIGDEKHGRGATGFGGVTYYKKENNVWRNTRGDGFWQE